MLLADMKYCVEDTAALAIHIDGGRWKNIVNNSEPNI